MGAGGARRLVLLSACVLWLAGAPGALGRSKKAKKSRGEAAAGHDGGGLAWKTWAKEHTQRLADGADDDDVEAAAQAAAFAEEYGCTIDRRSPQTLSEAEFVKDYYLQKPVVITGAAGAHWTEPFSREHLSENYGFLQVKALQKIGDKLKHKCGRGVKPVQTMLRDYLEDMSLPARLAPPVSDGGMPDAPWMVRLCAISSAQNHALVAF